MDRSDDLTRSRRFTALELGSGRSQPKIVTTREERVAPTQASAASRAPQPSLEFRARQRLRTYAEAATVLDRQAPRDASSARKQILPERIAATTASPTGYGDVVPEPPSPMAESYVGRNLKLTQREAEHHNLAPANDLVVPSFEPDPSALESELSGPIVTARDDAPSWNDAQTPSANPPASMPPAHDDPHSGHAVEEPQDSPTLAASYPHDNRAGFDHDTGEMNDDTTAFETPITDEEPSATPFQSPAVEPSGFLSQARGSANGMIGNASNVIGRFTSKLALVAKSLVANVDSLWQNMREQGRAVVGRAPGLSNLAAQSGAGVIERVSRLPANSLLTPQMGSLAALARADASHARPDAKVRPLQNDGVLKQEPEPRRTLLARKIQDNVERTETRAAAPAGPITQQKQGRMAFSSLALILITLVLLAAAAWATISIMQRTSNPITTIGQTERYRIEAVLDALFIDPGTVDGVIDDRTMSAIALYATEYGYSGPQAISATLLQHLENEAESMGVLDLIK